MIPTPTSSFLPSLQHPLHHPFSISLYFLLSTIYLIPVRFKLYFSFIILFFSHLLLSILTSTLLIFLIFQHLPFLPYIIFLFLPHRPYSLTTSSLSFPPNLPHLFSTTFSFTPINYPSPYLIYFPPPYAPPPLTTPDSPSFTFNHLTPPSTTTYSLRRGGRLLLVSA